MNYADVFIASVDYSPESKGMTSSH